MTTLPVATRIARIDRRIAALGDDPLSLLDLDALLDERSDLMRERDQGYRFRDRRRVRAI